MWRRRRFSLSILSIALGVVLALTAAQAVSAEDQKHPDGRLVVPSRHIDGITGDQLAVEFWRLVNTQYSESCFRLGRQGTVVLAFADACTVKRETTVYVNGIMGYCTNLDEPPLFAESYRDQVKCIKDFYGGIAKPESIWVTVNGRKLGDIFQRRYEMLAPTQSRDQLGPDNDFGPLPVILTYVVYGWGAWLVDLPVGTHHIHSRVLWPDGGEHVFERVITVVR